MKNNLVWLVYVEDINSNCIERYNIFKHGGFIKDFDELKAKKLQKSDFSEKLKNICMYYFWSKCEWEIVLDAWPDYDKFKKEKIDVYDQLMLNWDVFVDYCYNN